MEEKDKKLLIRYYNNQCTPEENLRARKLLRTVEAEDFFQRLSLQEWDEPVEKDADTRETYARWKERVNARILFTEKKMGKQRALIGELLRYAAVWLGVLVVSGVLLWQWQAGEHAVQTAMLSQTNKQGIPVRYLLPDSSEVYLAAGSTINYPDHFSHKTREVALQGEAFFQITHHPDRPFIIHTGEISTRVLGTSFKVTAVDGRPLEVAVATGKVGVSRNREILATLTPGNKVTWYPQEQKAVTSPTGIDGLEQWKNGDLIFDRLRMEYIADELQKRYGISIVFADASIRNNRISGTFAADKTAQQVMKVLAVAGKFRYESDNEQTYRIYKHN